MSKSICLSKVKELSLDEQLTLNIKGLSEENMAGVFFAKMHAIRLCELALLDLFSEGFLRGTVHTCLGQEGCAVGVLDAVDRAKDIVCSNHRGHGHFLAYSGNVRGLIGEIMGLPVGVCRGVGGSQHIQERNYYSNGILGGMPPVAVGMAFKEKYFCSGAVTTVFMGDGSLAEGSIYEALNLAALYELPILFVVEDNNIAQTTNSINQHAGDLSDRAESFGIPVTKAFGNDVKQVYNSAVVLLDVIRCGKGPRMLFLETTRLGPHSKGDDTRSDQELSRLWKKEPLSLLRGCLDSRWMDELVEAQRQQLSRVIGDLKRYRGV